MGCIYLTLPLVPESGKQVLIDLSIIHRWWILGHLLSSATRELPFIGTILVELWTRYSSMESFTLGCLACFYACTNVQSVELRHWQAYYINMEICLCDNFVLSSHKSYHNPHSINRNWHISPFLYHYYLFDKCRTTLGFNERSLWYINICVCVLWMRHSCGP